MEYFVNYCDYVHFAISIQDDKQQELADLNGLLEMIFEFKIKIDETSKLQVQEANNYMLSLNKKIENAQFEYDQQITKSAKKLERQVPDLMEKIKKLFEKIHNICLEDRNSNINAMVEYIEELNQDIKDISLTSKKINRQQVALGFDISNFELIV